VSLDDLAAALGRTNVRPEMAGLGFLIKTGHCQLKLQMFPQAYFATCITMVYTTQNTSWMTETSPQIKALLTEFYRIGDLPDPEAGNLWADHVFTQDGCLIVGENKTSGEEGSWLISRLYTLLSLV